MTGFKHKIQLAMFVSFLSLSNIAPAVESTINESQNDGTSDPVSNANVSEHTHCPEHAFFINSNHIQPANRKLQYQAIEKERHKFQQQQLEAYKHYIQNRNQQISSNPYLPEDFKLRQQEYLKNMEARRELIFKIMEQRRQQANERRNLIQQQMHKT